MLTPYESTPKPRKKKRLDVIYKPDGKAGEYAQGWACNLGIGCPHGCRYCYVVGTPSWRTKKLPPKMYQQAFRPKQNILKRLERDCSRLFVAEGGQPVSIFFSFTHDPFVEGCAPLMREALRILARFHIGATILTKSILEPQDFQLLQRLPSAAVGVTLTSTERHLSMSYWEPNAPRAGWRVGNLREAKEAGLATWVSCEPIIGTDQLLDVIQMSIPYTDRYALGRLNHHPEADKIDHHAAIAAAVEVLEKAGKPYTIKEGSR